MDAKIIAGILAAGGAALAAGGVYRMNKKTGYFKKGNSVRYDVSRIPFKKTSPLKGKTVVFLGSSVTKGFAAHNNAFAEYIAKKDSCICIKEAVNGTTLIDNCEDSYIERMRDNLDPERQVDLFICQLSTNDATRNSPLGEISESRDLDSFDVKTVCGAIEYIIAYAKETWHCRVMFYTNPQYDSDTYAKMVEALPDRCCAAESRSPDNTGFHRCAEDPEKWQKSDSESGRGKMGGQDRRACGRCVSDLRPSPPSRVQLLCRSVRG